MASRIKGRFVKNTEKSSRRKASDRLNQLNTTKTTSNSLLPATTIPEVWSPGERRVFEPAELQQRLMDGCEFCGEELRFTRVVSETVCAMGSMLYITCDCGMLNKINSGKVHHEKGKQKTRPIFDINTKIAIAMYDTGLGPHQVNRFFTNINLPGISQTSLKKREREVFEPIKQVAKRSLDDSLEEEKKASERLSVSNSGDNVPVSVKYDMGWQKRGSGRKYNSKSGVGSMIGHLTGKLIDLDLRSTDCRFCSYWEGKGKEQPLHNCTRNWYGTSKAMEPDVGVSLVQNIEKKGCTLANVIIDDDTTTIARTRSQIDHEVEKWSDMGHTRVQLGNKLYKIKEKYKKDFSTDDIAHLQKCFMYAIQSHKNDPKSIAENISAIVPHSFNCHDQCNESWCKYLQNPNKYRPTIQLSNPNLRVELESVFMKYVEKKNVNKLAPCGSTKDNESFNNMIAHKAPKNKHFCASERLESRVMCAASQKNLKFDYVAQINEECGLSPGKHTTKTSESLTRKRKLQNQFKGTTEFKRKKFLKLNAQKQEQVVGEIREGVTYQTEIDIQPTSAADITMISDPITPPILNSINIDDGSYTRVFFDLETSLLAMDCDILQISAIYNDNLFNQYITPTRAINKYASEVTGLTVSHDFLCYNGHRVDSCLSQQAL
ncbi:unnamed protein product [Mytilus coruscus]|uniref:Mutator-like transposase domain-containing protein n=1 Tax=Mytilus coruscus TaxID=42192 RepID=A0A6J8CEQ0_MYTCO|nr:unnamed protein product [Mytilus coruscus]